MGQSEDDKRKKRQPAAKLKPKPEPPSAPSGSKDCSEMRLVTKAEGFWKERIVMAIAGFDNEFCIVKLKIISGDKQEENYFYLYESVHQVSTSGQSRVCLADRRPFLHGSAPRKKLDKVKKDDGSWKARMDVATSCYRPATSGQASDKYMFDDSEPEYFSNYWDLVRKFKDTYDQADIYIHYRRNKPGQPSRELEVDKPELEQKYRIHLRKNGDMFHKIWSEAEKCETAYFQSAADMDFENSYTEYKSFESPFDVKQGGVGDVVRNVPEE